MLFSATRARSVTRLPSGLPYLWQRYGKYAVAYAGIIVALAFLPFWNRADLAIFNLVVGLADSSDAGQVVAIDLDAQPTRVRQRLVDVLGALASDPKLVPKAVVVDVALTAPPVPDALLAKLEALRAHGVDVYGALVPLDQSDAIAGAKPLDYDLYENGNAFSELGHAVLRTPLGPMFNDRMVGYYPAQVPISLNAQPGPSGRTQGDNLVPAIALAIANAGMPQFGPTTANVYFWTGPRDRLAILDGANPRAVAGTAVLRKIVVIGNPKTEIGPQIARSHLELLSWAIAEGLPDSPIPLFKPAIMWLLIILFSAVAVLTFVPTWRAVKTKAFALPVSCVVAFIASFALLVLFDVVLFKQHVIYTELTLVLIGIVTGIGVSFIWSLETIRHERFLVLLRSAAKVVERFDVFVSYARTPENSAWVESNLVTPLTQATCADGRQVRVFFDRSSIATGMDWYQRLVDGIEGSRYFVPVYSDGYFNRYYCRDEIELAILRRNEQADFVRPLSRLSKPPPGKYRKIEYRDARQAATFIEDLLRSVSASPTHAATTVVSQT